MRTSATILSLAGLVRQAGVLEPPPAMVEAVTEWVLAVQAARGLVSLEESVAHAKAYRRSRATELKPFTDALADWKADPTSWKKYKEAHELTWALGSHPGTRWSVRKFQKMTPEKREALTELALSVIDRLETRIAESLEWGENMMPGYKKDIARLNAFKRPGVSAPGAGEDVSTRHKVDLRGWRYGEELRDKVEDHATEMFRGESGEQMKAFNPKMYAELMESTKRYWDSINVTLSEKPVRKERAHWQDASRTLRVVLPQGAAPYQLADLEQTIKHELRHFSQGYLTFAAGYAQEHFADTLLHYDGPQKGQIKKRVPSPGYPSRHIMTPDVRQDSPVTPARLRTMLVDRLHDEGTPPALMRALLRNPKIDLHALDDVEFYTRLADAIADFERSVKRAPDMPRDVKANMIRLFTGAIPSPRGGNQMDEIKELGGYDIVKWFDVNPFFATIKRYAPGKWKKAVSELVKIVL